MRTKECDLLKSINYSNVTKVKEWLDATFLQSVYQHFGRSIMSLFGNESFNKESYTDYKLNKITMGQTAPLLRKTNH